jgi:murein peptide amidase A
LIIKEKEITSIKNNQILLLKSENFDPKRQTVLFIGVTHGEEPQGEYLINKFIACINEQNLVFEKNLLFIPCLNPDGKAVNKRGNSNNVDINRNFPTQNWEKSDKTSEFYSGETPASEVETKFLVEIIDKYKPDVILTLHAPYKIVNFDGPAEKIAEEISKINHYPVQSDIGYPTPGSFGTYCGIERNIPTITLELPDNVDNETLWDENKGIFYFLASL